VSKVPVGLTLEKDEIQRIFSGLAIEAHKRLSNSMPKQKKKVIVLAGPTGCGKSDFAMRLAEKVGGEIISADSMQVYKGMDIGTAKPPMEDRLHIPHHLIDIRNVKDPFNVVDFYYEARHCCQLILARDNIPIIVGGAGFYIHSLMYGPPSGPPSIPELRKSLEDEMENFGAEALYDRLSKLDPQYASTITKNDKQKIVRALEIITLTGKLVSKLSWKGRQKPLNYDFHCWFLDRPRPHLYERIEKRCDKMLESGLIEEVIYLEKDGLRSNSSAAQAIGYRQSLEYLDSAKTEADFLNFVQKFKQASRNYAKRQATWFNKEPLFNKIDLELHDYEVIMDKIMQEYEAT